MKLLILVLLFASTSCFALKPEEERIEFQVEYAQGEFCDFARMKMAKMANTVCLWEHIECGKSTASHCCWKDKKGTFEKKKHVVFRYTYCPFKR